MKRRLKEKKHRHLVTYSGFGKVSEASTSPRMLWLHQRDLPGIYYVQLRMRIRRTSEEWEGREMMDNKVMVSLGPTLRKERSSEKDKCSKK